MTHRAAGLYIVAVNDICEKKGPSHIIKDIGKDARPEVFCGIDTGALNWTGNPKPPTKVCARCKEAANSAGITSWQGGEL